MGAGLRVELVSWRIETSGDYPPDWTEIADRVKDEAGRRCVRCKHPAGDRMVSVATLGTIGSFDTILAPCDDECTHRRDGKLRVLTVHHMNGRKDDSRWWNLLALCQCCHLVIQGKVNPAQAYLHPHTGWFRIYAAGYYASAVLGLELSRAETELRIDELLHAGQPWLG